MLRGILAKNTVPTCHTPRVYSPSKVLLRPLSRIFLRIPKQYFVFVSSPKKQTHTVCNNRPNIVDLSYRGQTAKLARWQEKVRALYRSFARSVDVSPVHINPFSNEKGAVLLRIRLSSTLQRRKRSPKNGAIRKRSPEWSDLKTKLFENAFS